MRGFNKYTIQLWDALNFGMLDDDSGQLVVMTAGTPALATIYLDDRGTAASGVQTFTNGQLSFFTIDTVDTVDVTLLTATGEAIFIAGLTPAEHKVNVDQLTRDQHLVIPIIGVAAETDSGFDLPANLWIKDALIDVHTIDAGETVDVGLLSSEANGDADGFLDGISVAVAGPVLPIIVTNGSNEAYVSSFTGGALIYDGLVGTDVATDNGLASRINYITDGIAKSITHTASAAGALFYLHLMYTKLR